VRAVTRRASRQAACCWPIGEPGTRSFRFCDDEALPGKPYCAQHATLAYVKVRDRREEAA
jgi:GcrA cell cycle regulator